MELILRLCERDIFKHQQESYQINSLENLASKQKIFRIVKEQHGFMLTVRSKDCSSAAASRGLEQSQHRTRAFLQVRRFGGWWSQPGSNRRPHACKARALPAELWPLIGYGWWVWEELHLRPHPYQGCALTN